MPVDPSIVALRGPCLTFNDSPFTHDSADAMHYEADGLVIVECGRIKHFGSYPQLQHLVGDIPIHRYSPDHLILPGFIDAHVHYPQTQIIGSYGKQLIDWLNDYTFIAEQQFADPQHAAYVSGVFLHETLRVGTTTAAVYCTVHPESVDAFFAAAHKQNRRMIAGKVMMDRNAPAALSDTVQTSFDQSQALIDRWHGKGRLGYAVTPRFAPTSTQGQLQAASALWRGNPGTYMQTHLSENHQELAWVKALFPERSSYLDVYAHAGLLGPRALFGHAIHLDEGEWQLLAESESSVVHCPTSNAFLGSGLFNFGRALEHSAPVRTGLATDVGGGTSLSMLQTMAAAYSIGQFGGYSVSAAKAFYMATLGGARALHLDDCIGQLAPGMEADMVVLDLKSTPLIRFRMQHCRSLEEALFIQVIMGDDRATYAVYIAGQLAYQRSQASGL